MHELSPLIKDLAVVLGVASLVSLLFQKIRQPVVLGYLIAGIIIGPYTPPHALVTDIPTIQILSELGVIFLMFSLGLDFSFHKLKRVGFSASATGFFEVIFMLLLGFIIGLSLGWPFNDSLFLGAALAISSTTIIIKVLQELNLNHRRFAELVFGILVVEDLLAILLLVGLSTVVLTHQVFSLGMLWSIIRLILTVGGWFILGYFIVPTLFQYLMRHVSEETLTVVSVALCLFLVSVAAYFHYSTALGAFIMGSILAETSLVHRIEQLIFPIRNIFAAVFFVSVGMLIDPKIIFEHYLLIIFLAGITIIGKLISTGLGIFLTGQSVDTSLRVGCSMAQIGEFSFIIIGLGISLGAIHHTLYPIIVAISVITTFTTPYFIKLSGQLSNLFEASLSNRTKYFIESYTNWIYRAQTNSQSRTSNYKALTRLLINGIIVAIIFTLFQYWSVLDITRVFPNHVVNESLSWLSAVVLSSPFIWGMLTAYKISNNTDQQNPTGRNNIPFFLSLFFVFVEITILSVAYFQTWVVTILLLIIAAIFFKLIYKNLDKSYQWFENRLVKNLRTKYSRQHRYEELAPWDNYLVEIHINTSSDFTGKTLHKLQLREKYGINIVCIYRGSQIIFAPRGEESIQIFDKLIILGNDDQIEVFRKHLEKDTQMEPDEQDILANFSLKALFLDHSHPAIGKTIAQSKIREEIHGLVVGLERDGKRHINPHSNTILKKGDLLLVVGENAQLLNFLP